MTSIGPALSFYLQRRRKGARNQITPIADNLEAIHDKFRLIVNHPGNNSAEPEKGTGNLYSQS